MILTSVSTKCFLALSIHPLCSHLVIRTSAMITFWGKSLRSKTLGAFKNLNWTRLPRPPFSRYSKKSGTRKTSWMFQMRRSSKSGTSQPGIWPARSHIFTSTAQVSTQRSSAEKSLGKFKRPKSRTTASQPTTWWANFCTTRGSWAWKHGAAT